MVKKEDKYQLISEIKFTHLTTIEYFKMSEGYFGNCFLKLKIIEMLQYIASHRDVLNITITRLKYTPSNFY